MLLLPEAPKTDDKKPTDQQMPEQAALEGTPSLSELKLRYYELIIRIHIHNSDYLEICRAYQSVFADKAISAVPAKWSEVSQPNTLAYAAYRTGAELEVQ
jgi:hypothetical protein